VKIDAVVVDFDAVLIDSKDHQVTSSQVDRITGLKLKKLASLDGRATRQGSHRTVPRRAGFVRGGARVRLRMTVCFNAVVV